MVPYYPRRYRTTTADYSNADITSTTTCTEANDYWESNEWYTIYYTNTAESDAEEVFIQKRIVTYEVVWALISYAVILRKLIEQRIRPPPVIFINL